MCVIPFVYMNEVVSPFQVRWELDETDSMSRSIQTSHI